MMDLGSMLMSMAMLPQRVIGIMHVETEDCTKPALPLLALGELVLPLTAELALALGKDCPTPLTIGMGELAQMAWAQEDLPTSFP